MYCQLSQKSPAQDYYDNAGAGAQLIDNGHKGVIVLMPDTKENVYFSDKESCRVFIEMEILKERKRSIRKLCRLGHCPWGAN
jgi:hypothetical protein